MHEHGKKHKKIVFCVCFMYMIGNLQFFLFKGKKPKNFFECRVGEKWIDDFYTTLFRIRYEIANYAALAEFADSQQKLLLLYASSTSQKFVPLLFLLWFPIK